MQSFYIHLDPPLFLSFSVFAAISVARRISIRVQLNSNFLLIGIFAGRAFKLIARPDVRDRLRTQRNVKSCAKGPRKGPGLFSYSFFIRFRTHPSGRP